MRIGPRHPRLGRAVFRLTLRLYENFCARRGIFRADSAIAVERINALRHKLDRRRDALSRRHLRLGHPQFRRGADRSERARGPKLICNNEEERFSGERHTTKFPDHSIDELKAMLRRAGLKPERIDAWFSAWDYRRLSP